MHIPKDFELVVLESPYGSPDPRVIERNVAYARACIRDCLLHNESAYASHLLFTQSGILRDEVPEERKLGMTAGFAWIRVSRKTVVYEDFGTSKGMQAGISRAMELGHDVEHRNLPKEELDRILAKYPI